jgi:glycosyltransferase involved in cell wall biosynthesis
VDTGKLWSRVKILQGQRNYTATIRSGLGSFAPIVYHGLANINLPLWRHRPQDKLVVTIHDIIPLLAPSAVSRSYYQQFRWALPRVLQVADRVIVISRWTSDQVSERYPWATEKLRLIPHGLDGLGQTARENKKQEPGKTVLLSVSRFEHYKRFPLLVSLLRALGRSYVLRVVCDAPGLSFLQKEAGDLVRSGNLEVYSQLSQKELARLYGEADLLLLPSLYEGFCLPAAEGLAAGVPLVYQRGTALEEFVPEGLGQGISERQESIEPWVEAVRKLRDFKDTLLFQQGLEKYQRGRRSWGDVARETKEVYESLV